MTEDAADDLYAAVPAAPKGPQAVALAEATSWVGGGVVAVGLGETAEGEPCVVVYASGSAQVPDRVGGLPVRVEESGPVLALDESRTGPLTDPGPES